MSTTEKIGPLRLWFDQLPYVVNATRMLTSYPTINGPGKSAIERWTEVYGCTLLLCMWGHLKHHVPWADHALSLSCPGLSCYWQQIGGHSLRKGQRPELHGTEHRPVRPNYGGAKVISWDALEVTMWRWIFREPGFSPTNGKKWFPKGYKVTTQNRCAEKKMRKWFCENNGSDPAHPKHTTLLVLTPKATRPHRFDSVALPKSQQKVNTPQSWCHILLPLQML